MAFPLLEIATPRGTAGPRSMYCEFAPPAGMRGMIVCTWQGQAGWARQLRLLPDGCVDLVWDGDAVTIVGARPGPARFTLTETACNVGLRLRAGAAGGILGWPAHELPSHGIGLGSLWPAQAALVEAELRSCTSLSSRREALADMITRRVEGGNEPDRHILAAVTYLAAGAALDSLPSTVGLSARELRRRFRTNLGFGAKAFQRVVRFRDLVLHLRGAAGNQLAFAELAAEFGYSDQAHLSRDCRKLSGSTPAALAALCAT